MSITKTQVNGQDLYLLPEKAVLWKHMMWITDLHLGKIRHFRKSGIPVPEKASLKNFENLIDLINQYQPSEVLILGDLFHSHFNDDWDNFSQVIRHFSSIHFILIPGNHDTINDFRYESLGISIIKQEWECEPFIFTHIPLEKEMIPEHLYNICGHLHPTVRLKGKGRQQLSFPCFYFGENQGYLPAFGIFTGNHRLKVEPGDKVFIIADQKVIEK